MPTETLGLTHDQIAQFNEEGTLLLRGLLDPASLQPLRQIFADGVEKQANEWLAAGRIADPHRGASFETRYAKLREQFPSQHSNSWRRILISRPMYDLWQHPQLLPVMRDLLGDELLAHGTFNGRPRPPHQKVMTIDWHQDAHYYRDYNYDDGRLISVWIPLVPVRAETGCLQVSPGSRKLGLLKAERLERNGLIGVPDDVVASQQVRTCEMNVGDVLLFDDLTLHRSLDNVSNIIRWSVDIRFCTAANPQLRAKAGRCYKCFSASDPSSVESYESWAAQFDYDGEF
jgi:ectoine hydroxylase-related dioxygenase (phytanoyl-CoA dioxygenase family)